MALELEYFPLEFSELPVEKTFTSGNTYLFEFHWNEKYDFFRVKIKDEEDNELYIAKLVYGNSLYHAVVEGLELDDPIVPFDIQDLITDKSIEIDTVDSETLGTVKLYLISGDAFN